MLGKIRRLLWELWPFFDIILYEKLVSVQYFESIGVLNSYFIHRYIIIKYWSNSMLGKIRRFLWELWPFFDFIFHGKLVSVRYLLKALVY